MKKVLQVAEPIINTFTSYGALFSILPESAAPWLMNNFIQLNYVYIWKMVTFDSHRMLLSNCPSIDYYEVPRSILLSNHQEFKDIIMKAIDRGEYLFFYVDRYYLSITEMYMREHYQHEIFLYGYDLDNNLVYVGDNFMQGKFSFQQCSLNELIRGYMDIEIKYPFMSSIRFLTVHENEECKLNIKQIIHGLDSYINSKEIFDIKVQLDMLYGISIYDLFLKRIRDADLDIRFFHLLYEHKVLMEMRVGYLLKHKYLIDEKSFVKRAKNLKEKALIMRNMVLKYYISKSKKLLEIIYNKLLNMKKEDYLFCVELKKALENTITRQ